MRGAKKSSVVERPRQVKVSARRVAADRRAGRRSSWLHRTTHLEAMIAPLKVGASREKLVERSARALRARFSRGEVESWSHRVSFLG